MFSRGRLLCHPQRHDPPPLHPAPHGHSHAPGQDGRTLDEGHAHWTHPAEVGGVGAGVAEGLGGSGHGRGTTGLQGGSWGGISKGQIFIYWYLSILEHFGNISTKKFFLFKGRGAWIVSFSYQIQLFAHNFNIDVQKASHMLLYSAVSSRPCSDPSSPALTSASNSSRRWMCCVIMRWTPGQTDPRPVTPWLLGMGMYFLRSRSTFASSFMRILRFGF